ncbi:MAG: TlpA family protein disulfide reductase [Anaerolineae bacterium]
MDEPVETRGQTGIPSPLWLSVGLVAFVFLLATTFAAGLLVRRTVFRPPEPASPAQAQPAEMPASPVMNSPAPDFTLDDLDGNRVTLADHQGQPVLINFWATWCGPCEAEMPAINEAYLAHRDEGLVVLAVDVEEHPDTVRSFVEYYDLDFTILTDREGSVTDRYQARGLPTSFFIDRQGTIAHIHIGQMSKADIARGLAKIR